MKRAALALSCVMSSLLTMPAAHALDGITVQIGESSESTTTYRIGAQFEFGRTLWQSDSGGVLLNGYWDAGVTRWSGLDATSGTLTPMFRLNFGASEGGVTPFLEAGIGAAYFTETNLDSQDLGSKFQTVEIGFGEVGRTYAGLEKGRDAALGRAEVQPEHEGQGHTGGIQPAPAGYPDIPVAIQQHTAGITLPQNTAELELGADAVGSDAFGGFPDLNSDPVQCVGGGHAQQG